MWSNGPRYRHNSDAVNKWGTVQHYVFCDWLNVFFFPRVVIKWLSPVSFSPRWWIRALAFISQCWPDKDLVLIAG